MSQIGEAIISLKTELASFKSGITTAKSELKTFSSFVKDNSKSFKEAGVVLSAFAATGVYALTQLVRAISDSELQVAKLTNALKQTGNYTEQVRDEYLKYSIVLQRVTKYSDEAVISAMALGTQIGIMPADMEKAITTATDLASALGIGLDEAMKLLAKAGEGNTGMLSRYGIVLDQAKVKAEGFGYLLEEINKKFGGSAVAEAKTFTGQIEKLKNSFDDLEESLGAVLMPTISGFVSILQSLVTWFQDLSPGWKEAIANTLLWGTVLLGLSGTVLLIIGFLPQLVAGFSLVSAGFSTLLLASNPVVAGLVLFGVTVAATILIMEQFQNAENKKIEQDLKFQSTTRGKIKDINDEILAIGQRIASGKLNDVQMGEALAMQGRLVLSKVELTAKAKEEEAQAVLTANAHSDSTKIKMADETEFLKLELLNGNLSIVARRSILEQEKAIIEERLSSVTKGSEAELVLKRELLTIEKTINDERKQYENDLLDYNIEIGKLGLGAKRDVLKQELALAAEGSLEQIRLQKAVYDNQQAINQKRINDWSTFTGQIVSIGQAMYNSQVTGINNVKDKDINAENARYEAKKLKIKETVMSQAEYDETMKSLEEGHQATISNINDRAVAEERNRKKQLKPFLVAEALANTFVGATKALAQGGIFGLIGAALVTAAGMINVGNIEAQALAKGVDNFKGGMALVGEKGAELVNLPRGSDVIPANETSDILSGKSGGGGVRFGDVIVEVNIDKLTSDNVSGMMNQIAEAVKQGIPEGIKLAKATYKIGEKFQGESF